MGALGERLDPAIKLSHLKTREATPGHQPRLEVQISSGRIPDKAMAICMMTPGAPGVGPLASQWCHSRF